MCVTGANFFCFVVHRIMKMWPTSDSKMNSLWSWSDLLLQKSICHMQHSVFTEVNMNATHFSVCGSILKLRNPSWLNYHTPCSFHPNVILLLPAYLDAELASETGATNWKQKQSRALIPSHQYWYDPPRYCTTIRIMCRCQFTVIQEMTDLKALKEATGLLFCSWRRVEYFLHLKWFYSKVKHFISNLVWF